MARPPPIRIERDPREDERWFQRLPPGHQARFRGNCEADRVDWMRLVHQERRAVRRCVLEGALLFAAGNLMAGASGIFLFLAAALAGALVGLAWRALDADALLAPVLAMPSFFALHLLAAPELGGGFGFARFCYVAFGLGAVASWLARERRLP